MGHRGALEKMRLTVTFGGISPRIGKFLAGMTGSTLENFLLNSQLAGLSSA